MADEHRAWEPMSEEQERRRIQNRLAQETFRRRMENNRVYQQGDPKPLRPAYTHEVYAPPPPQSSAWTSWDHRSVVSQPHHQDLSASRSECRSSRAAPVSTQLQVNMPAPAPDEDPHEMQGVLAPYEYRRVHGSIDETAVRTGPTLSYEVQSALGTLSYRRSFDTAHLTALTGHQVRSLSSRRRKYNRVWRTGAALALPPLYHLRMWCTLKLSVELPCLRKVASQKSSHLRVSHRLRI